MHDRCRVLRELSEEVPVDGSQPALLGDLFRFAANLRTGRPVGTEA